MSAASVRTPTRSPDVLQQAHDAVDGGVGEHQHVVRVQEGLEHIEHDAHVAGRGGRAHGAQRAEQRPPPAADLCRAHLDKLTDGAHDLK